MSGDRAAKKRAVLAGVSPAVRRILWWSTVAGVAVLAFGLEYEPDGLWVERPFLANIVSALGGGLVGLPIAIVVVQSLARQQLEFAEQQRVTRNLVALSEELDRRISIVRRDIDDSAPALAVAQEVASYLEARQDPAVRTPSDEHPSNSANPFRIYSHVRNLETSVASLVATWERVRQALTAAPQATVADPRADDPKKAGTEHLLAVAEGHIEILRVLSLQIRLASYSEVSRIRDLVEGRISEDMALSSGLLTSLRQVIDFVDLAATTCERLLDLRWGPKEPWLGPYD